MKQLKISLLVSLSFPLCILATSNQAVAEHRVVERGPFHRVWEDAQSGSRYTELENGLHYWDEASGQWLESKDLIDEILVFDGGFFPLGRAFEFGEVLAAAPGEPARIQLADPSDPNALLVAKRWLNLEGRTILVETVDYTAAKAKLDSLPLAAALPEEEGPQALVADSRRLPERASVRRDPQPIRIAQTSYQPQGFVIDFTTLPSSASFYTFTAGETYHIPTSFYVGSSQITFANDITIKYGTDAWFLAYGPVSFPATGTNPVMTSEDDDLVGTKFAGSTGNPTYAAAQALWIYYMSSGTTVENLCVRWAKRAIQYDSNYPSPTHYMDNVVIRDSTYGIYNSDTSVVLTDVKKCDVTTPTYTSGYGSFSGSVADDCPDMVYISGFMNGSTVLTNSPSYSANDCPVIEGLVGGTGIRTLIRFTVAIKSDGTGHFWGERDHYRRPQEDWKEWDNCHNHCHLADFVKFDLKHTDGTPASGVTGTAKLGWYLYDHTFLCNPMNGIFPVPDPLSDCQYEEMGMSVGYCDIYNYTWDGMWLDVTDVDSGDYKVQITMNPGNKRYEGNYENNVITLSDTVTIP